MRSMTIIDWSMLDKRQTFCGSVSIITGNLTFKDDGICSHGLEPDMSPKMDFLSVVISSRDNKKLMFLRCLKPW